MEDVCFPKSFRILACKFADFSRQTFRLQTQGQDTARPNSVVVLNMPENSVIHMPSLRMFMDFAGGISGVVGSGNEVFTKLGNDKCLIARVECYVNGIAVQNPMQEYSTCNRILNIGRSNVPKDQSIDRALSKSNIDNIDAPDVLQLCYTNWLGFLGEASAEWMSTELVGSIQIRITMSGTETLVAKQVAVPITTQIVAPVAVVNAQNIAYAISNIYFTISSCVPPMAYNVLLTEILQSKGVLEIYYKNYFSYSLDNITSTGFVNRFGLSSGSIDVIYATVRDSSYLTTGCPAFTLPDYIGSQFVSNNCRFRAFNNGGVANVLLFKTINNVQYPQYNMQVLEALANTAYVNGKMPSGQDGNLITSQQSFFDGLFQDDTILNVSSELGVSLKSGYNSLGINTFLTASQSGIVFPPAGVGALRTNTASASSYVLVETTASLVVAVGKSVAVSY